MVTMETTQTQVDMDRDRKVRWLGRFYECVFCHMDQSSGGFTKGPGKRSVFVGGYTSSQGPGLQNDWSLIWDPRSAVSTVTVWPRLCFHSIMPSSAVSSSAAAFSRSVQLFCIFPPQQAAAGPSLKAPAPASGQRAFRDFSLLAGDFILLYFSLEPSGQSLFNVMAVYFNKSHRFSQFKCVFSVVEVSQRWSILDSTGRGGNVMEQPHKCYP